MARKTGQKTVKIELPTGAADDQAPASTAGDDDIEQAFSQLPEGTIAKIYRMIDGREAYVTSMAPNAASEEAIAKLGSGTYIVRMWGPIGDGNRKGYKGQRQVMIAAAAEAAAPVAAPAPNVAGSLLDQLAGGMLINMLNQMQQTQAMQAQQAREHSAAMMALVSKMGERPASDPILTTLLTSLLEKRTDPIEQATKIAEIAARNSGTKAGTSEVLAALELVEKIREMGGGDGDGRKSDGGWVGMIRDALPLIVKGNQQPAAAPAPVAVVATPNGDVPQLTEGNPNESMASDYLTPILPHLAHIQNAATNGTAPETAADFFVSFIPVGHYEMLYSILDRPSIVPDIVKRAPALAVHEKWLTALVREMRSLVAPEGDGDGEGDDARG